MKEIIKKITHGFVIQTFNTELNDFISQEFVVMKIPICPICKRKMADVCEYKDSEGNSVDPNLVTKDLPYYMVQPDPRDMY